MEKIHVVDSHTGGEPTRVVLDGVPPGGLERYRRAIVCEPRGHEVLVGALLEAPADPACVARVTFFNPVGLLGMCGHGMMGVVTTLAHIGRLAPGEHRFETPAGAVTATLHADGRVSIRNVVSYRKAAGVEVAGVTGEVAYGGNWFFLVAEHDHGLELSLRNLRSLTDRCVEIREAVRAAGFPEVDHVELFGPARQPENHSRNFVLCPGGEYDRSPCGTGTSAKLACLAASGRWPAATVWRQESLIGSVFEGSYECRGSGIVPTITGRAFVTGESTLLLDPDDPFCRGIDLDGQ